MVTALLLLHLRQNKVKALAMKPFCSGSRDDVRLLQSLQPGEISDAAVNPYFYNKPLAPIAAAGNRKSLSMKQIVSKVELLKRRADVLLIEGAGGVMVPISAKICMVDVIAALNCEVILIARNQLGTLNHTLLSMHALQRFGISKIKIILIDPARLDLSARSNLRILRTLIRNVNIFRIRFFPKNLNKGGTLEDCAKKNKKTLASMMVHH